MTFKRFTCFALVGLAFSTLVGCGATQDDKVEVGIIQYAEHPALSAAKDGFLEALEEGGYKEGENLVVNLQNAQGDQANLQTMVEKMAGKNDVQLAIATPAAQALLNVDSETPSVFTAVTDPVSAGLVKDLDTPEANMTGTTDATDVAAQIEILLKAVPTAKTVGIFYNSSEVNSQVQAEEAEKALKAKGIKVLVKTVTSTNDVQQVMMSLAEEVDAIYLPTDNTVASTIATIGEVLTEAKVPAMGSDEAVLDGVLLTSGVDFHAIGKQAGKQAVELLKGKKVSEVPVQAPQQSAVAINEQMAKALGLDMEALKALESN